MKKVINVAKTIRAMQVGERFYVPYETSDLLAVRVTASRIGKETERKFTVSKDDRWRRSLVVRLS